jgi:flavin reductase (DIM6/NTAB) family NADH-FMN oxidoreductase RutF
MVPQLTLLTPSSASPRLFAEAMSALAGGVAVVTCELDGRPWGLTVTAFTSVSVDPPTALVSIGSERTADAIAASGRFGVSLLAEDQLEVAFHASAPGKPKFLEPLVDVGHAFPESPMVADALAHFDCHVEQTLVVADHTIFVGRARAAHILRTARPLVYHSRQYRTLRELPAETASRCLAN